MYHNRSLLRKALAALLCLSLILGSAVSLAETVTLKGVSDNKAPDISNIKITEGGQTLKVGQTVHISAKITDDSVITGVWCYMDSNTDYGINVDLEYNPETDLYEGAHTFTTQDANAEYYISNIDVYDEYENNRWIGGKKFGVVALNDPTATGSAGPCIVTDLTIAENEKTLKPGDTIHFGLTIFPNDNVEEVEVYLEDPSGYSHGIYLSYNVITSRWEGTYTFDTYGVNGTYYTNSVEYAVTRPDGGWRWYSTYHVPYQWVTLAGASERKDVSVQGVDLVQKGQTLKGGETITAMARLSDNTNVSAVYAYFSLLNYKSDYDEKDYSNYHNSSSTGGFSIYMELNKSTGRFEGSTNVYERLVNGTWYLNELEINYTSGGYQWVDTGKSLYFIFNGPDLVSWYTDEFVADAYGYILGREPDPSGRKSWGEGLASGKLTGAAFIDNLINSDEFKNRKLPVGDVVEILYRAMLRRASDPAGKQSWIDEVNAGKSYSAVINGFAGSIEFRGLCHRYGITSGSVSPSPAPTPEDNKEKIKKFVTRCYQIILGREPDAGGLTNWTDLIANGKRTAAAIILDFMSSEEFKGKNHSNSDKVEILYQAMLGRASDKDGKANWLAILDKNNNINTLINGFCGSQEFVAICKEYGITPGSVDKGTDTPQKVDPDKAKAYINHLYKNALGRDADTEGLNSWAGMLVNGTTDAKKAAKSFLTCAEFSGLNLNDEGFISRLYKVCMNRDADNQGMENWKTMLAGGATREQVIDNFLASSEFIAFAATFGL